MGGKVAHGFPYDGAGKPPPRVPTRSQKETPDASFEKKSQHKNTHYTRCHGTSRAHQTKGERKGKGMHYRHRNTHKKKHAVRIKTCAGFALGAPHSHQWSPTSPWRLGNRLKPLPLGLCPPPQVWPAADTRATRRAAAGCRPAGAGQCRGGRAARGGKDGLGVAPNRSRGAKEG